MSKSKTLCKNCQHPEKDHFSCEIGSFCKSCPTENHTWEHTFQPQPEKHKCCGSFVEHHPTCPNYKSTHLSNSGNMSDWAEKEAQDWLDKMLIEDSWTLEESRSLAALLRRVREEGDAATYEHAVQICEYQQMFYDERSDAQGYHALKIAIEKIRAAAIAGKGKP